MGIERPSGRRYYNIACEFVRLGYRVRLLALHPDLASCRQRRFVSEGVEIWYLGQMHVRKRGSVVERFAPGALLWVLLRAVLGLVWGIICSPAEWYHLGKPQPVNGMAALIGVVLLRRQRFYVDCDDDELHSNRFNSGWQRRVFGFWQWLLPRLAAGVTVNTRFLEARMRRAGIECIAYVPNGVAADWFAAPDPGVLAGLRLALGLAEKRLLAYAGTLALQNHPVDLLLAAFEQIAADMPDTVLLLIGSGEDLALLREQACAAGLAGRVYFCGQVPHRAVPALLALAEISVDPVHDDAAARARSPLKVFESMALGVPVITGDVGDRAAILDGVAGLVVAPGDAAALAAGIRLLLGDEERRRAATAAARRQAEKYRWERLAQSWIEVYPEG